MKRLNKKIRSSGKIKAGIMCPACKDTIFSMHRHDFQRCMCGKVFVDGGDEYMRCGAEPPIHLNDVKTVYRPYRDACRLMSKAVRAKLPMTPPPSSYTTDKDRFHFVWHLKNWKLPYIHGPYPKSGRFAGAIYKWTFTFGPFELRRWSD